MIIVYEYPEISDQYCTQNPTNGIEKKQISWFVTAVSNKRQSSQFNATIS